MPGTENLPAGLCIFRLDEASHQAKLMYLSRQAAAVFGHDADDYDRIRQNNSYEDMVPESMRTDTFRSQLFEIPENDCLEFPIDRYGEGTVWIRLVLTKEDFENSCICHAIVQDVTAEMKHSEEQQTREERNRMLSEDISVVTFDYDVDTDVLDYTVSFPAIGQREMSIRDFRVGNTRRPNGETYENAYKAAVAKAGTGYFDFFLDYYSLGPTWFRAWYLSIDDDTGRVIRIVGRADDISSEKEKTLELAEQARRDALTGLLNRNAFQEHCLCRPAPGNIEECGYSALVIIDIDELGRINDQYGRAYGDKIVCRFAETIKAFCGENDAAARYGGDEFTLCLEDGESPERLSERIRILSSALEIPGERGTSVTASIGVAVCPVDGQDFETIYEKADRALYRAKVSGDSRYVFYSNALDDLPWSEHIYTKVDASDKKNAKVYIRTFGYFDVFVDGQAIPFRHAKAKELLALLVDRRGGYVSTEETIDCLWEEERADQKTKSRSRKTAMRLKNILEEYGIDYIIEYGTGGRRVVPGRFDCDLYNYLTREERYAHLFKGSYLLNYSWGENTTAELTQSMFAPRGIY